jgi:phosphatidylinositol glycan class O
LDGINARDSSNLSELEEWLLNYVNVLCINSWQVHFLYWSRILNTLK